jgi:hypothetical protein
LGFHFSAQPPNFVQATLASSGQRAHWPNYTNYIDSTLINCHATATFRGKHLMLIGVYRRASTLSFVSELKWMRFEPEQTTKEEHE